LEIHERPENRQEKTMSNEGFPLKANGIKKHHFLDVLVLNDCFVLQNPLVNYH